MKRRHTSRKCVQTDWMCHRCAVARCGTRQAKPALHQRTRLRECGAPTRSAHAASERRKARRITRPPPHSAYVQKRGSLCFHVADSTKPTSDVSTRKTALLVPCIDVARKQLVRVVRWGGLEIVWAIRRRNHHPGHTAVQWLEAAESMPTRQAATLPPSLDVVSSQHGQCPP